ncbi:hypothetical protein BdWA1_001479 [Babesia duncani]|uniref:Uncharacterized protein n=1 Tax=Babesia duncani TaxID=323732 RepID=A0AAD9PH08_9APIC|nr:hypothetical protein BdWA1_004139 [Babesia duncani]KAK2198464.1 hypothetical protein BdWA1_001479 [Babesia duncani]
MLDDIKYFLPNFNRQVSIEYASSIGHFTEENLEHKSHLFKTVDVCSNFSLISHCENGVVECRSSTALFTIIEQKGVFKSHGLKSQRSLLVCVRCEYKDLNNNLSSFVFQISLDVDVHHCGLFHQIAVNANGSILMLVSSNACVVANIPNSLEDANFNPSLNGDSYIYANPIVGTFIINAKSADDNFKLVKAVWHDKFVDTLCVLCIESVTDTNVANNYRFNDEIESVFRIFNIRSNIDEAVYTIRLSESECRTGAHVQNYDNSYSVNKGIAVDFCCFLNDGSDWGRYSIFILSNHGFLFVFCPIILSNCLESFECKNELIKATNTLLKNGLVKCDGVDQIKTPGDITKLLEYLTATTKDCSEVNIKPLVLKMEMADYLASVPCPIFESFVILTCKSQISLVASGFHGALFLFRSNHQLLPYTSKFQCTRPDDACKCVQFYNRRDFHGIHSTLHRVSNNTCLHHSSNNIDVVALENDKFSTSMIAKTTIGSGNWLSLPFIIQSSGAVERNRALALSQIGNCAYFIYNNLTHLRPKGVVKVIGTKVEALRVYTDGPSKAPVNDAVSSLDFESFGLTKKDPIIPQISKPQSQQLCIKIHEKAAACEVEFSKAMENIRNVLKDQSEYKEKITKIIKHISTIDSKVLLNLKSMTGYNKLMEKYVEMHKDIKARVHAHFSQQPNYAQRLQTFKVRIENIKKTEEEIQKRRNKIVEMKHDMEKMIKMDKFANSIIDTITYIYFKVSQKMKDSAVLSLPGLSNESGFEQHLNEMVNEWFAKTFQSNLDKMIHIYHRIQEVKNRMYEIY